MIIIIFLLVIEYKVIYGMMMVYGNKEGVRHIRDLLMNDKSFHWCVTWLYTFFLTSIEYTKKKRLTRKKEYIVSANIIDRDRE